MEINFNQNNINTINITNNQGNPKDPNEQLLQEFASLKAALLSHPVEGIGQAQISQLETAITTGGQDSFRHLIEDFSVRTCKAMKELAIEVSANLIVKLLPF